MARPKSPPVPSPSRIAILLHSRDIRTAGLPWRRDRLKPTLLTCGYGLSCAFLMFSTTPP